MRILRFAQYQDSRAAHVQQRRDLGQDAFGEPLHRLEIEQRRGRLDDDFETAAGFHHPLELLVAAQRRGQRREQLVGRELGLRLVVVDVVVDDDAPLRRLAGLAGAQDDTHRIVLEVLADELDQVEARRVALHDDVEQHDRHVRMGAHELAAFGRRIGRDDIDPLAVELVVREREPRAFVHGRLVVDHRDFPARSLFARRLGAGILDQVDDVVWFGHEFGP